ncbi:ShlB/FhaC/HecB family hemolysin secretion/activation protein [Azospirillum fermentarium]|uniref:ShlB/FhaC/HecB family hemolysin secretion/activation protein n=1 Tax=Azospirillum fermentarium TaxID=1233114 RepID=UPI002226112B|nr:ShlB/FhaC/HecB family hemolysin secretion/activation protein [Azospirillum fermentarium]
MLRPCRSPKTRCRRTLGGSVLFGAVLAVAVPAAAQDFERIAPKTPPANPPVQGLTAPAVPAPTPGGGQVLMPALKGLVFLSSAGQLRPGGISGQGIDSARVDVLDTPDFRSRLAAFLGRPVTLDMLNEISRLTVIQFRDSDHPLVDVVIPEQDISNGSVQILALEFRAGTVRTEGAEWFSESLLLPQVRTTPGSRIIGSRLLEDVNWLNQNPFRRVDLVYERAQEPGRSDIALRVQDRLPFRAFAGYENTGTESTERGRSFLGFNWGNALGLDHQLSYQFTASPGFWNNPSEKPRSASHSGSYFIPLPWRHTLTLFGSYSESVPEIDSNFHQIGRSAQASARYGVPLPAVEKITHEVTAGFDWKRSNNDLEFGGVSVSSTAADVAQWMVGYSASRPDGWGGFAVSANLFVSPGGFNSHNTAAAFQTQRANTDARYVYGRLSLDRVTQLPHDASWVVRLQGQMSNGALLSSEQLGLGGGTSVRGYEERASNGDQGFIAVNELRSPEYGLIRQVTGKDASDRLLFLAFWDYGIANNRTPGVGEAKTAHLSGVGVGFRYSLPPYVSLRFDYGWGLITPTGKSDRSQRPHLGLTVSY